MRTLILCMILPLLVTTATARAQQADPNSVSCIIGVWASSGIVSVDQQNLNRLMEMALEHTREQTGLEVKTAGEAGSRGTVHLSVRAATGPDAQAFLATLVETLRSMIAQPYRSHAEEGGRQDRFP